MAMHAEVAHPREMARTRSFVFCIINMIIQTFCQIAESTKYHIVQEFMKFMKMKLLSIFVIANLAFLFSQIDTIAVPYPISVGC